MSVNGIPRDNAILAGRGRFEGGIGFAVGASCPKSSGRSNARGAVLVEPSESGGYGMADLGWGDCADSWATPENCEEQD